jgi:hypothetical protein
MRHALAIKPAEIPGIAVATTAAIGRVLRDALRARTLESELAIVRPAINLTFRHAFARHPRTPVSDATRAAIAAISDHRGLGLSARRTHDLIANHVGVRAIRAEAHHTPAALHPLPGTPARKKLGMSIVAKDEQKANEYRPDKKC